MPTTSSSMSSVSLLSQPTTPCSTARRSRPGLPLLTAAQPIVQSSAISTSISNDKSYSTLITKQQLQTADDIDRLLDDGDDLQQGGIEAGSVFICPDPLCMRLYTRISSFCSHVKEHKDRDYLICFQYAINCSKAINNLIYRCGAMFTSILNLDAHVVTHTLHEMQAPRKPLRRPRIPKAQHMPLTPTGPNGYFLCDHLGCKSLQSLKIINSNNRW